MTNTTKQAEWPEKVYLTTRHWGDNVNKLPRFMGIGNTEVVGSKSADTYYKGLNGENTVEYIRADLESPLTQDEMKEVFGLLKSALHHTSIGSIAEDKIESAIAILKGHLK